MLAIVTDSSSDISPERAASLGITVVPLFVIFGDTSYRDNIDLGRREFFEKLRTEKDLPTTSQPTAKMFEDAFRPQVEAGNQVLCINISSHLSGTMNAARAGAQAAGGDIEIYDSQSAAGGLGMMAMRAADLARQGKSRDQIVQALNYERKTQRLYACFPDLSHLQRTGRIGRAQARLGGLMKIVPVLALEDGQVHAQAQVRTFARAQETMLDLSFNAVSDVTKARFMVMHTDAPELAEKAKQKLIERLNGRTPVSLEILEAGPVIATHAGAGAVGVFVAQDE